MGSRKLRNQLRRGQCPGARQLLPRPAPRRRRWTEAGDGWVLPQALRTLSGREPRAPAGPANRRPPGRGRRGSSQAPGRVARGRPGQPPPQRAPPPPPRSPRRGEGAGAAGARNGPAAPSAARERRELEGAGRHGRRTCARRAWVWVRGAGAAGARGRGTPATLDSASPAAEVSAPRTMVSGGRALPPRPPLALSFSPPPTRRAGRGRAGGGAGAAGSTAGTRRCRRVGPGRVGLGRGRRTFGRGALGQDRRPRVSGTWTESAVPPGTSRRRLASSPLLHARGRPAPGCPPNRPLLPPWPLPPSRLPPAAAFPALAPPRRPPLPSRGTDPASGNSGCGALTVEFLPPLCCNAGGVSVRPGSAQWCQGVGFHLCTGMEGPASAVFFSSNSALSRFPRLRLRSEFITLSAGH